MDKKHRYFISFSYSHDTDEKISDGLPTEPDTFLTMTRGGLITTASYLPKAKKWVLDGGFKGTVIAYMPIPARGER